jgi:hypothetical protein
MAASSFQNLYTLVGSRAMDEVVPALIVSLESSDSDDIRRVRALNGLTGILSIRSRELLLYIIPRLTELPMTRITQKLFRVLLLLLATPSTIISRQSFQPL